MDFKYILYSLVVIVVFSSCKETETAPHNTDRLTITDDCNIGNYIDVYIQNKADTCDDLTILSNSRYAPVYNYIDKQKDKILASGVIKSPDTWKWTIRIFDQAKVEHAFVSPGGYIYLSKGLLLTLHSEAELIAILAQAMINIDRRYASKKLESSHSFNQLAEISLGGSTNKIPSLLAEVKENPYALRVVEDIEREVQNLMCTLDYNIRYYSTFIVNTSPETEWRQLYPNYDNRVEVLSNQTNTDACLGRKSGQSVYKRIKSLCD